MKEGSQSKVCRGEPAKKYKKRRGNSNFSNTKRKKERKQVERKKPLPIEGRGTPADLSETFEPRTN